MEIVPFSIEALFTEPQFEDLQAEYWNECHISGLPYPEEKILAYRNLEKTGALTTFGAVVDGVLVGFLLMLSPVMPHYGRMISVVESVFVGSAHRKSGAGLALMRHAEQHARDIGSPGIFFSAPVGSRLETLLPRLRYRHTNAVFFKDFK